MITKRYQDIMRSFDMIELLLNEFTDTPFLRKHDKKVRALQPVVDSTLDLLDAPKYSMVRMYVSDIMSDLKEAGTVIDGSRSAVSAGAAKENARWNLICARNELFELQ